MIKTIKLICLYTLIITHTINACIPLIAAAGTTVAFIVQPIIKNYQNYQTIIDYKNMVNAAFADTPDLLKVINHFSPPDSIIADYHVINRRSEDIKSKKHSDDLSKYIIKDNESVSRVILAAAMKHIITEKNYTTVDVPEKYLFLTQKESSKWNEATKCFQMGYDYTLHCIAQKINGEHRPKKSIELQQMREFIDIIETTGFQDIHYKNFLYDSHNKLYFIDTERFSFSSLLNDDGQKKIQTEAFIFISSYYKVTEEVDTYLNGRYDESNKQNKTEYETIYSRPSMKSSDTTTLSSDDIYRLYVRWNMRSQYIPIKI
ncbi:MAG TPA: hypothetical protein VLB80_04415 [Candidatus Babeliales bacterium]|nr:hypothetical protein [Candidatus Babeliales bacterium]